MSDHNHEHGHGNEGGHSHHYILPDSKAIATGVALLVLTVITVALSFVHLGKINFIVGMLVATVKATLVCAIFMNLAKDVKSNAVIFLTSFVFLAIFIVLAGTDLLYRGDVYVKGPLLKDTGVIKFAKGWEPSPELVAHGKAVYAQQCASCHGVDGKGDGPAAAALNPRPRNFHADAGWKNGRKPSQIFKTLKEGLAGGAMASFATLPQDDRWGLTHYVASLGPNVLTDSNADLAAIGIDPTKAASASDGPKAVPVEIVMKNMVKDVKEKGNIVPGNDALSGYGDRLEAKTFTK